MGNIEELSPIKVDISTVQQMTGGDGNDDNEYSMDQYESLENQPIKIQLDNVDQSRSLNKPGDQNQSRINTPQDFAELRESRGNAQPEIADDSLTKNKSVVHSRNNQHQASAPATNQKLEGKKQPVEQSFAQESEQFDEYDF